MLPSLADFANQYSADSFLFSFGPQAPWTPDFSRTFHHRVLRCGERVHRGLWRLRTRRRIADVLHHN